MSSTKALMIRDDRTFGEARFLLTEIRAITKQVGDGPMEFYEPETVTHNEFMTKLHELGQVTNWETYICTSTLKEIVRGGVVKGDGRVYYFAISKFNGKFYKEDVKRTIQMLDLSGGKLE